MDLPLSLQQIIELIGEEATEEQPLARLALAAQTTDELSALGEAVLDRSVHAAREAGCSWAEIGTALGVTRQAAHVRFNDRSERHAPLWPAQLCDRAREVVEQAAEWSRELGHNYVGTEHVLLALIDLENDLAAHVLREFGLTADAVRGHAARIVGERRPRQWDALGVAPRLKRSFELARNHAERLGHRCASTEHLLLGLVDADGVAAQILSEEGVSPDQLRLRLAKALDVDVSQLAGRRRRSRRLRATRC